MLQIRVNGSTFFYNDAGHGDIAFVFIHNTGGDHQLFKPQLEYFSKLSRVIVPDLRGHGQSDKGADREYSIESYGDDINALCHALSLKKVVVIGSSTGGNVAFDLCCRYPEKFVAAVMIDCGMFFSDAVKEAISNYKNDIDQMDIALFCEMILRDSCLSSDRCWSIMKKAYAYVPDYVWQQSFDNLLKWDAGNDERVKLSQFPVLYIEACGVQNDRSGLADLNCFYRQCSHLMTGKVVGSGHYPSLEVPEQINAMIQQFLRLKVTAFL